VREGGGTLLILGDLGNTFKKSILTEVMMSTKVTTKGQVTIPKAVRDLLDLKPGSEVKFKYNANREIVLERADGQRPPSRFEKLLGHAGPGPTTDEMMAILRGDD
jgi:AbrB family looped-hinge helix DNA binding protein